MLGINADEKADIPEIVTRQNITWRSWLDGVDGPIVRAWRVPVFPSIFLIDHKGVIRHKQLADKELDAAIESLIREAEKASTGS